MKVIKFPIFFFTLFIFGAIMFADNVKTKIVEIVSEGKIIHKLPVEKVDYIDVYDTSEPPINLQINPVEDGVSLIWDNNDNKEEDSFFNVYRSAGENQFSLIASGLTESSYIDSIPAEGWNTYYVTRVDSENLESIPSEEKRILIPAKLISEGLYVSLTGFQSFLIHSKTRPLDSSHASYLKQFASGIGKTSRHSTYYALESVLDSLADMGTPEDLKNVHLITVIPSDDWDSLLKSDKYSSKEEYRNAISRRIREAKKGDVNFTSYVLGYTGGNINNEEDMMKDILALSSSQKHGSIHSSMEDLNAHLKEIAQRIVKEIDKGACDISVKIKRPSDNTRIRITFDNSVSPTESDCFIDAVYSEADNSLKHIDIKGLSNIQGNSISTELIDDYIILNLKNVETDSNGLIINTRSNLWTLMPLAVDWERDNTYSGYHDMSVRTGRHSAIVKFVMDCSTAYGEAYPDLLRGFEVFIDILQNNTDEFGEQYYWNHSIGQKEIKNILFIGSSFVVPQGEGTNEWYRYGPMAPSIAKYGMATMVIDKIKQTYPEAKLHLCGASTWELNFDNPDIYAPKIIDSLIEAKPDIIYFYGSDNTKVLDGFDNGCRDLLTIIKENAPDAEIYLAASWWGGEKERILKQVCSEFGIRYVDMAHLNTKNHRWQAGDYYYVEELDDYFGLKYTVVMHPNDVGMMRLANQFLKASGFGCWDLTHNIRIYSEGPGRVTTPNPIWPEDGIVTLRIEEGRVDSISVVTESGNEITATHRSNSQNVNYSDYYTFTMPPEDVEVRVIFNDEITEGNDNIIPEDNDNNL